MDAMRFPASQAGIMDCPLRENTGSLSAARCAGILAALIGAMSLLGWTFDIDALKQFLSRGIAIKANTSVSLLLAGLSLCLFTPERQPPWARRAGQLLALLALMLGALSLSEHLVGWNLGIDQFLFREPPGALATLSPGRIGPPASLCFTLGGAALLLLHGRSRQYRLLRQVLAMSVALIASAGLLGYLYGVEALYGIAAYTAIAFPTALGLVLLAGGILLACPAEGVASLVYDRGVGGGVVRLLLPAAILLPAILGWLRLRGEQLGLYEAAFGTAAMMLIMAALLSTLVLLIAAASRRTDRHRQRAEEISQRAHDKLEAANAQLEAVFDVVNVGMLLVDERGLVRRVNDTLARWVGRDLSALGGSQPGDFVGCVHAVADPAGCGQTPHCAACPIRNAFESALRTGRPIHDVETEVALAIDGSEVRLWLEVSADPLVLEGKRHAILAMNNITARKRAEDALRQTAVELTRSNEDLGQFAYVASHDLQEPLRMVAGFLQLLEKKYGNQLDSDAHQFIEHAVDGAKRMQTLIDDLLSYSRVGTRGRELAPIDAGAALQRALDNLRTSIEETAAEIAHGELPTVRADATQLAQLFQNLIGNALKFRSAAQPAIRVDACRKEHVWQFSVRDNGIGIAPESRDRVFLIFQRLHTRRQYPGTGIGLAICKKIVERHGGQIWVESQPGQGATFSFTLPR
jgi:signal transduction histidine kinase